MKAGYGSRVARIKKTETGARGFVRRWRKNAPQSIALQAHEPCIYTPLASSLGRVASDVSEQAKRPAGSCRADATKSLLRRSCRKCRDPHIRRFQAAGLCVVGRGGVAAYASRHLGEILLPTSPFCKVAGYDDAGGGLFAVYRWPGNYRGAAGTIVDCGGLPFVTLGAHTPSPVRRSRQDPSRRYPALGSCSRC